MAKRRDLTVRVQLVCPTCGNVGTHSWTIAADSEEELAIVDKLTSLRLQDNIIGFGVTPVIKRSPVTAPYFIEELRKLGLA